MSETATEAARCRCCGGMEDLCGVCLGFRPQPGWIWDGDGEPTSKSPAELETENADLKQMLCQSEADRALSLELVKREINAAAERVQTCHSLPSACHGDAICHHGAVEVSLGNRITTRAAFGDFDENGERRGFGVDWFGREGEGR